MIVNFFWGYSSRQMLGVRSRRSSSCPGVGMEMSRLPPLQRLQTCSRAGKFSHRFLSVCVCWCVNWCIDFVWLSHHRTRFCCAASVTRLSTVRAWLHRRRRCQTDVIGLVTIAELTNLWKRLRSRTAHRKKAKLRTRSRRRRRHQFSPWRQLVSVLGCLVHANWNSKALRSSGIVSPLIPTPVFPTLLSGLRKMSKVTLVDWDSKSKQLCCATM